MEQKENEVITMPTNLGNPQTVLNSFAEPHFNNNRAATLSLVESIDKQNRLFKDQQQNIESQLKKLKKISQSLLNQNIELRSLYKERTNDIAKLINSITINTNESIIDYQHQQFLMKELNCGILKQIKLLAKQASEISERIKADQKQIDEVNDAKMKTQQQIVTKIKVKLQSQLNRSKIEEDKQKQLESIEVVNQISNQVTNLIIQNKDLQLAIQDHHNQRKEIYSNLSSDKEQWKSKLKDVRAENAKYINEISIDNANEQRISEELKLKQQKYESIKKSLNEQIKKFQKAQRINQQLGQQKERIKSKINQANKRITITQGKLDNLKYEKSEITQKLKNAKTKVLKYRTVTYQS